MAYEAASAHRQRMQLQRLGLNTCARKVVLVLEMADN